MRAQPLPKLKPKSTPKKSQARADKTVTAALKQKVIEYLANVPIAKYAYQKAGVPKPTYYKWRETDPEFATRADKAIVNGRLVINDVAMSQLIKQIHESKTTAIIFWLKHNHPSFNPKVILEVREPRFSDYSTEQLRELTRAMFNMGLMATVERQERGAEIYFRGVTAEDDARAEAEESSDDEPPVDNNPRPSYLERR